MKMRPLILFLVVVSTLFIAVPVCRAGEELPPTSTEKAGPDHEDLKEKWGIEILALRVSAEGYMLDFRYKVLDPGKAGPLFDRKIKPLLIHEKTGATFSVPVPPKIGALRQTRPPVAGKHYFIIFANPAKYVKPGDRVTVTVGDFRAEGLTVE